MFDDIEDDVVYMKKVIDKLFSHNINTPHVILFLEKPIDDRKRIIMQGTSNAIREKKVSTVFRQKKKDPIGFYNPEQTVEKLKYYQDDESLLLFKAPMSKIENVGICEVSSLFAKITLLGRRNDSVKTAWKDHIEGNNALLLNSVLNILGPYSSELDGLSIIFSEHVKGEGMLSNKLLFWGI